MRTHLVTSLLAHALVAQAHVAFGQTPAELAGQAKEVLRTRCLECHGGARTSAGVRVLDREQLVEGKKLVVPGQPDASELLARITARDESIMPEPPRPPLTAEETDIVRRWIAAGAPAFPADVAVPAEEQKEAVFQNVVGVDYVLKRILADVRTRRPEDRLHTRYFSINHILTAGATPELLDQHRDALAKAVNHLSWMKELVRPRPIDAPTNSIFAVDLRQLGWHVRPYQKTTASGVAVRSELNPYDLALLEYPYGIAYESAAVFDRLAEEYLIPAKLVRPVPYVRADWFVSVATQPPLYEDFLQLPFDLKELETRLGIDAEANIQTARARRAGLTVSGVSRNNRVVERHPGPFGGYWKSYDFRSSKGPENLFRDPLNFREAGGEMIFSLPNGLQGYYVADANGDRIDFAPTDIVTDKFAEDKTVRNGLACMRCHDRGMKPFADTVRPALERLPLRPGFDRQAALDLYAEQQEMDALVKRDTDRFLAAMRQLQIRADAPEPLIPVTRRFLDDPIHLGLAAGELGLARPDGLNEVFRTPQFSRLGLLPLSAQGVIRRDAWEDYYDAVVRGLGLGVPVVPLDGLTRRDLPVGAPPFAFDFRTSKKSNVFEPGEELVLFVENKGKKELYVELIGTSAKGKKVILTTPGLVVKPGETYRFPPAGKPLKNQEGRGKEQVTLYICDEPFPAGELLQSQYAADRVVHPFYQWTRRDGRLRLTQEPTRVVRSTIEVETR